MTSISRFANCRSVTFAVLLLFVFGALPSGFAKAQDAENRKLPETVSFNAHIRPIMSNTCFACHGPDEEENHSSLRLDSFEAVVEEDAAIVPGNAEESSIYQRMIDEDDPMPPAEFLHQLSDYDKALFKKWIQQGAKYQDHWSYASIQKIDPPTLLKFEDCAANEIDRFVLSRLESEGLTPSRTADRVSLIRRLSLDLIGLPPTPDEVDEFLSDTSEDAYEKLVDRLMSSPKYGERMASQWLDIVRFSDTVGFHGDQNQRIFPYRDYVINALNNNKPFDEFTREQLAGDLLNDPTEEQLAATGLVRLNMMTREGGAQPEEYMAKYAADRVRMLGTAWLGSTTGCCECHNHKFDPFTIKDFYAMGAFFDDLRQWGVYSHYGYTPNPDLAGFNNNYPFPPEMRLASDSLQNQIRFLEASLDRAAVSQCCAGKAKADVLTDVEFKNWVKLVSELVDQHGDGWFPVTTGSATSANGTPIQKLEDGSFLLTGDSRDDQISLSIADLPFAPKSIRFEVLPHESNQGFVGRGKEGRFSMSLSSTIDRSGSKPDFEPVAKSTRAQFVRIELPKKSILSLAEVQIFAKDDSGDLVNVAPQGTASQVSTSHEGVAALAIDGETDGDYHRSKSVTHTAGNGMPWWEVDLGSETKIEKIVIWNRTDNGYSSRLKGFSLSLLGSNRSKVWQTKPDLPKPSVEIVPPETTITNPHIKDLNFVLGQADRFTSKTFSSGQPPLWLGKSWHSGSYRFQLPKDETKLKHTAVFQFEAPIEFSQGDKIDLKLNSADIGRVRISASPLTRFVAGDAASNRLKGALRAFSANKELASEHTEVLIAAWHLAKSNPQSLAGDVGRLRDEIAKCRSGLAMTLVAQQTDPDKFRKSRVLPRGDWQSTDGDEVDPATPSFLPQLEVASERKLNRLDLANWLTAANNPLTARHYVNRTWKHFFGTALSAKADDLGNQGEWPSHPELLDWLANSFRSDWDMKKITYLIVTSNTYRQQASVRTDLSEIDPYNRLLSQQSARRLEAEAVRDNALAISGLLFDDYVGGPSVKPYQPDGHYRNIQFPNRGYTASPDFLQYRRGVYMHWQRTFLHPMLVNFDAPSRDECVADRTPSNSPQQALTLLNDPQFMEASKAFASRVLRESSDKSFDARIEWAFKVAISREPNELETTGLKTFFDKQLKHYSDNLDDAKSLLSKNGNFNPQENEADDATLAAWTQVCRVILNLHETITRY
jgi:hypothetical protein